MGSRGASCHLGIPMVIESHPRLEDGAPFPTLYWLTCPVLVKRVSKLESAGWLKDTSERLSVDPGLRSRFTEAIERLIARRDEHDVLTGQEAPPGGGPERVKCLHAHVAHELAGGSNPIGALGLAETGWPDCRVGCVESAR